MSRVLIIEHEGYLRDVLLEYLAGLNCETIWAENLAAAMEGAPDDSISAIIYDPKLPTCEELDAADLLAQVYPLAGVIMITGTPTLVLLQQGYRHRIFDFVIKPFQLAELGEILRRAEQGYRDRLQHRELAEKIARLEHLLAMQGIPTDSTPDKYTYRPATLADAMNDNSA